MAVSIVPREFALIVFNTVQNQMEPNSWRFAAASAAAAFDARSERGSPPKGPLSIIKFPPTQPSIPQARDWKSSCVGWRSVRD